MTDPADDVQVMKAHVERAGREIQDMLRVSAVPDADVLWDLAKAAYACGVARGQGLESKRVSAAWKPSEAKTGDDVPTPGVSGGFGAGRDQMGVVDDLYRHGAPAADAGFWA